MVCAARKVTFMVISDTHNLELETLDAEANYPISQPLPAVDVLLHCGDVTQIGGLSAYKKAIRLLSGFDAELKLVIAGNHDISLDGEHWRTHLEEDDEPEEHEEAVEIMTGKPAKEAGVTYLTEATHTFTLKDGAEFSIYASPYQPECGDWAFSYKRNEDRFSIPPAPGMTSIAQNPILKNVDIVMTHGPPRGILDLIPTKQDHAGCDALFHAIERVRPLMHCFGHIHEGHGTCVKTWPSSKDSTLTCSAPATVAEAGTRAKKTEVGLTRGQSTLMVNAAIMDESNKPSNAPWLVSLYLPIEAHETPF